MILPENLLTTPGVLEPKDPQLLGLPSVPRLYGFNRFPTCQVDIRECIIHLPRTNIIMTRYSINRLKISYRTRKTGKFFFTHKRRGEGDRKVHRLSNPLIFIELKDGERDPVGRRR